MKPPHDCSEVVSKKFDSLKFVYNFTVVKFLLLTIKFKTKWQQQKKAAKKGGAKKGGAKKGGAKKSAAKKGGAKKGGAKKGGAKKR